MATDPRSLGRGEQSKWLKALRASRGMHQADLADRLGLSRSAVANYERGSAIPADVRQRILEIFEIDERPATPEISPIPAGFSLTAAIRSWRGAAAALDPNMEEEFIEEESPTEVPTAFLIGGAAKIDRHDLVRVSGMSMAPRVMSGERVLIYRDPQLIPNSIVLAESPDRRASYLKVLRFNGAARRWELHSLADGGAAFCDLSGWTVHGYAICIFGDDESEGRNVEWRYGKPLKAR